jgi:hypothetical protein
LPLVYACSNITNTTVWLVDDSTQAFAGPVTVPVSGNTITVPAQTACNAPQAANYVLTGCTVMGNYYAGTTLNGSNAVSSTINVLTPGTYTITSNTNNGYSFSGSGTFNSVGPATITLFGNGTPVNAGTNTSSDHISVSVCLPQDFGLLFEFSKVTKRIFVSIDNETDE